MKTTRRILFGLFVLLSFVAKANGGKPHTRAFSILAHKVETAVSDLLPYVGSREYKESLIFLRKKAIEAVSIGDSEGDLSSKTKAAWQEVQGALDKMPAIGNLPLRSNTVYPVAALWVLSQNKKPNPIVSEKATAASTICARLRQATADIQPFFDARVVESSLLPMELAAAQAELASQWLGNTDVVTQRAFLNATTKLNELLPQVSDKLGQADFDPKRKNFLRAALQFGELARK